MTNPPHRILLYASAEVVRSLPAYGREERTGETCNVSSAAVVRSCSAPQTFSTTYRTTNVVAAKQQVAAVHSRFMPGAQYMAKAAGPTVWKRAATGECRR